jgi:cob(I)alamin adenosyltransferase
MVVSPQLRGLRLRGRISDLKSPPPGLFSSALSIATKTGDCGTTGLMYNRRVSKCHPRIEACGSIDELNAAIGLARATVSDALIETPLVSIQLDLITLMGELATLPEDLERFVQDGFKRVTPEMTARLDALVKEIESQHVSFKGWATPGATAGAAALDLARTVARRAERRVCELRESGEIENGEIVVFLNRLSDVLWLLARKAETQVGEDGEATPASP